MTGNFRQIQTSEAGDIRLRVWCACSRQRCQDSDGRFKFGRENLCMDPILKPPSLFVLDIGLKSFSVPELGLPERGFSRLAKTAASKRVAVICSMLIAAAETTPRAKELCRRDLVEK